VRAACSSSVITLSDITRISSTRNTARAYEIETFAVVSYKTAERLL
jgi:hypothetical protein